MPLHTTREQGTLTLVMCTEHLCPRDVIDNDVIIIFYLQNAWDSTVTDTARELEVYMGMGIPIPMGFPWEWE